MHGVAAVVGAGLDAQRAVASVACDLAVQLAAGQVRLGADVGALLLPLREGAWMKHPDRITSLLASLSEYTCSLTHLKGRSSLLIFWMPTPQRRRTHPSTSLLLRGAFMPTWRNGVSGSTHTSSPRLQIGRGSRDGKLRTLNGGVGSGFAGYVPDGFLQVSASRC